MLPTMSSVPAEIAVAPCAQVTGAVGWRREGIRYKKNEVSLSTARHGGRSAPAALSHASGHVYTHTAQSCGLKRHNWLHDMAP